MVFVMMPYFKRLLFIFIIFVGCTQCQQQVPQHSSGGQPVHQQNAQMNQQSNQPHHESNIGGNFAGSHGQQAPNSEQVPNTNQQQSANTGQQQFANTGQQQFANTGQQQFANTGQQQFANTGQQQFANTGQQQFANTGQHVPNPTAQNINNQQFHASQANSAGFVPGSPPVRDPADIARQQEMRRIHADIQHNLRSRQVQGHDNAATYKPHQLPPGLQQQQLPPHQGEQGGFQHLPPGVPPPHPGQQQGFQQLPPGVPPPPGQQGGFPERPEGIQGRIPPVQHQPISNVVAEPKFDLLSPSMAMDYRVLVAAGKEDCFYQYVRPGAQFYVSFYTLRGGDGKAGFAVRDPKGTLVHPYQWLKESEYETTEEEGGYYSVCVDNQFSRSEEKLVNFYITSFMYDEWDKGSEELEELNIAASNFTDGLGLVDHKLQIARQFMSQSRSRVSSDWELLSSNRRQVALWSIVHILVICGSGLLHVYFVRKLFDGGASRSRVRT